MRGMKQKKGNMTRIMRQRVDNSYEAYETALLTGLLEEGDTAIDLGARDGHYMLRFSKAVGETGAIFAFEPDPQHCRHMRQKMQTHTPANITLIEKAVSNTTGNGKLYLNLNNTGDHRIFDSHDNRYSVAIQTVRLDTYFRAYTKPIKVIKMDVQASEYHALLGMANLLRRNEHITIGMEFWPHGLRAADVEPVDVLKLLIEYGFQLRNINRTQNRLEPLGDFDTFIAVHGADHTIFADLLCTR